MVTALNLSVLSFFLIASFLRGLYTNLMTHFYR
jgi:hypothetical protein